MHHYETFIVMEGRVIEPYSHHGDVEQVVMMLPGVFNYYWLRSLACLESVGEYFVQFFNSYSSLRYSSNDTCSGRRRAVIFLPDLPSMEKNHPSDKEEFLKFQHGSIGNVLF